MPDVSFYLEKDKLPSFCPWRRQRHTCFHRLTKIRRTIVIPGKGLCPRRTVATAALPRIAVGMVQDPIFLSIRGFEKAIMAGCKYLVGRRPFEHRLRRFFPAGGV